MMYYSLQQQAPEVSFKEAALRGIAPDRGLYFPRQIPRFSDEFWRDLPKKDFLESAQELMQVFTGDSIPYLKLREILERTLSFEFPLIPLEDSISVLELFHGPTMAFKDVGATFMAGCLGYFSGQTDLKTVVLVATSGDTGGAVARGFLNVPGVEVVILYPKDKVSDIQERQLTTLGANIRALRVQGTFDDCQAMVKRAFQDPVLFENQALTSANSINIARWLPQMLYYVRAVQQLPPEAAPPVFSVPSGNFGNLCAGLLASRMGMPAGHFIAATNSNDTIPRYMESRHYDPHPAVASLSNAMDVADPSNFVRILELFENDFQKLGSILSAYSFTDAQTLKAMETLFNTFKYTADPHGAVGYLGLVRYLEDHPDRTGIFLETAHPIKFRETVETCLDLELELPMQIRGLLDREKVFSDIGTYEELREALR
ncbi:threonine synthase [Robiginitalea sp.]|uniref:threonine synthase n=1 Tax=Robiginitalea sp. TaxID=1902411 RepID=UPI003C75548D